MKSSSLLFSLFLLVSSGAAVLACEGPARLPNPAPSAPTPPSGGSSAGPLPGAGGKTVTCEPKAPSGAAGDTSLGGASGSEGPAMGTPVGRYGHLRLEGAKLVSESGEPVQLRGISSMWLNWENEGYATDLATLLWMRDNWNLQVIRAAMGVDVDGGYITGGAAGKANMLAQVEKIIANAEAAGVYVIVDFHSHHANEFEVEAGEFFANITSKYGHLPNLILETFNEPLPALTWTNDLRPYHVKMLEVIRGNDPDEHPNLVVLGTPNYDQRPDDAIATPILDEAVMYAVHFYSCTHGAAYRARAQTALNQGLPLFVTEWGATNADGGVNGTPACYEEADAWLNFLATEGISWAAWKLDNCAYEKSQNGVEDTSCILKAEARLGGFPEQVLNGHGPYVVKNLLCR